MSENLLVWMRAQCAKVYLYQYQCTGDYKLDETIYVQLLFQSTIMITNCKRPLTMKSMPPTNDEHTRNSKPSPQQHNTYMKCNHKNNDRVKKTFSIFISILRVFTTTHFKACMHVGHHHPHTHTWAPPWLGHQGTMGHPEDSNHAVMRPAPHTPTLRRVPQEPLEQAGAPPRFGNELEVARIMESAQVKAAQVQAQAHNTATTRLAAAELIGLLAVGGAIYFPTNKVGTFIDLVNTHLHYQLCSRLCGHRVVVGR